MTDISIVIPCYNEKLRLPPTLKEIAGYCRRGRHRSVISEIIIVDDGSRDSTVEVAEWYREALEGKLKILRHSENAGKWAAIRTGIDAAVNNTILLMDADGSASIYNIDKLNVNELDAPVFGSRFMSKSRVEGKSLLRSIVSRGYRMYALAMYTFASGKTSRFDPQAPFKIFRKTDISVPLRSNRFAGDVELALSLGKDIRYFPLDFIHVRGSKVSIHDSLKMAKETLVIAWRYRGIYSKRQK